MKEEQKNKLKHRNLKANKGKKRWRKNIITDDVLEDVQLINKQKQMQQQVRKKIQKSKLSELFVIDTESNNKTRISVPVKLDPNRFKKKIQKKTSIGEIKKIKKLKIQKGNKKQQNIEKSQEIEDIWDTNENKSKQSIKKPELGPLNKQIKAKAIMLPAAGQSINPQFKQHEKFLSEIVKEQTEEKPKVINDKSKKILKKIKPIKKNLKVRLMEREQEKKKLEKQQAQQFFELKKYKKELKENDLKNMKKQEKIKNYNQKKEELKAKKGIVKTKDYQMKVPDFQLPTEIKGKLRYASNQDEGKSLIREQYDNYFRRGLLAQGKGKQKKRRIPKYKYHTTDREHANLQNEAQILGNMED